MEKGETKRIDGQDIVQVFTRKTMYDDNCVVCRIGEEEYLLSANDIKSMLSEYVFTATMKRTKVHLTIDVEATEETKNKLNI